MSDAFHTELVNFNELTGEAGAGRRAELTRHVAVLFSLTSEKCSDEQVDIYDSVLVRLVDMVEVEVRKFVAERLASLRRGPEETIRELASDEIEVAESILRRSTVLRDKDLIAIAAGQGDEHRAAIAQREVLSPKVTDVLVERGDQKVKRHLAANQGATFSPTGMSGLISAAGEDPILQTALSERQDLAAAEIHKLVAVATDTVRQKLLEKHGSSPDMAHLVEAAKIAQSRMTNDYWLARYDFETARGRVLAMERDGRLAESSLRWFANEERFPEAVVTFACLTRIGLQEASHWMVRVDTDPFIIVCKAHGFSTMTVTALLNIGPWRHRLTEEDRNKALQLFDKLSQDDARRQLAHWETIASL